MAQRGFVGMRRHTDDGQAGIAPAIHLPDEGCDVHARFARQAHVHEHAVWRTGLLQPLQRRGAVRHRMRLVAQGFEVTLAHDAVNAVVLDDQHRERLVVRRGGGQGGCAAGLSPWVCGRLYGGRRERQFEPDYGALAFDAFQAEVATHQRHQPLADGQPQAGTTLALVGWVLHLVKRFEDRILLCQRDANACVADEKHQPHLPLSSRGR